MLKQITNIKAAFYPSRIDVKFKDGKTLSVNADDLHGDDIIFQVEKYSRKLSQQEDLKNQ
ncbi:hypothetical protein LPJ55_000497 [Coemansia sp. RSA 990]|nr:hypothetical protein LPJ55_000497 [Coemansia sp. RSA 990]